MPQTFLRKIRPNPNVLANDRIAFYFCLGGPAWPPPNNHHRGP